MRSGDHERTSGVSRAAGQSNVLAVVLLVGLVVVVAVIAAAAGSALLEGVQSASQEEVARDAASTTDHTISEVVASGQSRRLAAAEGTDLRVEDGGQLRVEMIDTGSGSVCGRSLSVPLGAVVHEVGEGTVVYEGGAIWSVGRGGGVGVERPPPIAYDGERPRIAVQSVSAGSNASAGAPTVRPNRTQTQRTARSAEALLSACPRSGNDDLRLTVRSPYADGWERALSERLQGDDVRITRNGSTVRALIPNATAGGAPAGAHLANVRLPDRTITPDEPLDVLATVANNGPATDATLELALAGTPERTTTDVRLARGERTTVPLRLENNQLNRQLDRGSVADYRLTLRPDGSGNGTNATVTGSFVYATEVADLHLRGARPVGGDGAGLGVRATLQNLGERNGTTSVTLEFENASLDDADVTVSDVRVPGGRRTAVTIPVDASALAPGEYDYRIEAAGETVRGTLRVRDGDDRAGASVGDLRVSSIDPVASSVAPGEPFAVDVSLENPGSTSTTGTVALDVANLNAAGVDPAERRVELGGGDSETVRVEVPAGAVRTLWAGELHAYEVRVGEGGATLARNGSFYLGPSDAAPRVVAVSHETGDELTVRAALANRGQAASSAPVEVRLRDAETGDAVLEESASTVALPRGASTTVEASIPSGRLSGTYEYEIAYGGDAASGTVELSGLDEGESGVTSTIAGEGTVTVLGTEVSYERQVGADTWEKYWAPVSVAVRTERDGSTALHQLENPAAGDDVDDRNLNAPGTQTQPVRWRWEQSVGEEVRLTLRSQLWQRSIRNYELAGERTGDGPTYDDRTYRDYRPPDRAWNWPSVSVDAGAGENPDNVRVLRDGDRVPEIRRGFPDQRNVSEVLNQGASHRIDPETGELDLGPNEAVFLFELTDDGDYPQGIWQAAKDREGTGDPNFNDLVALVEFDAASANGTDATLSVDDDARGLTVSVPAAGGGNGSVSGGAPDVETGPVEGTVDPDPAAVDAYADGETQVEVDVGHVTVG